MNHIARNIFMYLLFFVQLLFSAWCGLSQLLFMYLAGSTVSCVCTAWFQMILTGLTEWGLTQILE